MTEKPLYDLTKPVCNDLAKAPDLDAYYRSYLTGDADKDQMILNIMRTRNRQRSVIQLSDMVRSIVRPPHQSSI